MPTVGAKGIWCVPYASFILVLLWTATAYATVERPPVKSSLTLKPNETYLVALDTTDPIEIGWTRARAIFDCRFRRGFKDISTCLRKNHDRI